LSFLQNNIDTLAKQEKLVILGEHSQHNELLDKVTKQLSDSFDCQFFSDEQLNSITGDFFSIEAKAKAFIQYLCCEELNASYSFLVVGDFQKLAQATVIELLGCDCTVDFLGYIDDGLSTFLYQNDSVFTVTLALDVVSCFYMNKNTKPSNTLSNITYIPLFDVDASINTDISADIIVNTIIQSTVSVKQKHQEYQPLYTLQSCSRKSAPIICIPGAGDNIAAFMDISFALGNDCCIYGLQPRGVDGQLTPYCSVRAIANNYLKAINKIDTDEGVHLIGHSFGGWVALALANLLESAGITVCSLTIIDSKLPDRNNTYIRDINNTKIIDSYLKNIESLAGKKINVDLVKWASLSDKEQLLFIHNTLVQLGILSNNSLPNILLGPLKSFAAAYRISYCPTERFTGKIAYVYATDHTLSYDENKRKYEQLIEGWSQYSQGIDSKYSHGNHITILKSQHCQDWLQWWQSSNTKQVVNT
jgi:thioesterase domain-containing protein